MTSRPASGTTPPKVAELATETAHFGATTLIGTFGTPAAPGALVRLRDGTIQRVVPGDQLGGAEVIAIDAARIALARSGRSTVLRLPGS